MPGPVQYTTRRSTWSTRSRCAPTSSCSRRGAAGHGSPSRSSSTRTPTSSSSGRSSPLSCGRRGGGWATWVCSPSCRRSPCLQDLLTVRAREALGEVLEGAGTSTTTCSAGHPAGSALQQPHTRVALSLRQAETGTLATVGRMGNTPGDILVVTARQYVAEWSRRGSVDAGSRGSQLGFFPVVVVQLSSARRR